MLSGINIFGLILSPHAARVAINLYKTNFNNLKVHSMLITVVGKSTCLSCLAFGNKKKTYIYTIH